MLSSLTLSRLGSPLDAVGIEPSCGVLDVRMGSKTYRIVVDCGLIPVRAAELLRPPTWHLPDLSKLADGKKIDAVCLTHAHGDHAAALPLLIPYLAPHAWIWMTVPTAQMLHVLYEDERRRAERGRFAAPYELGATMQVEARIKRVNAVGEYPILDGVPMFVWPEGHINGACSFTFRLGGKHVHYSGDRCSHDQPGILGAAPLPPEWRTNLIIANSDCTYGADFDADSRTWQSEMDRGLDQIVSTLREGHPVTICAFAIHRSAAVAHELNRRGVPEIARVFLDGSARDMTDVVLSDRGSWSTSDLPLDLSGVGGIDMGRNRRSRVASLGRYAVVTTPGMGGPGAATFWLKRILPDPNALLVFTSYLAPDTDGARIMAAVAEREATGVTPVLSFEDRDWAGSFVNQLPIACQVLHIRLGSHDSRGRILDWFAGYTPEAAVLCHGSDAALSSIQAGLAGSGIKQVVRSDPETPFEPQI